MVVGEAVCAVVRLLVTLDAAVLSDVVALEVSRRTAASIIQLTGVSAGEVGVVPADELHSGASRLSIVVVTTVSGCRGAASRMPTGSDCTAALRRTTAPEAGLTNMSAAEVEWAGDEAAPPGATLCFGRLLDPEEADDVASVPVRGALTGAASLVPRDGPVDVESPEWAGPFDSDDSDEAELVGDLDLASPASAPAAPAAPKTTATSPSIAPTRTAMSRDGNDASTIAISGVLLAELSPPSTGDRFN